MKSILIAVVVVLFLSCGKNGDRSNNLCDTYFVIDSTSTPRSSTVASGITSIIRCYGSNLCYTYTGMEITNRSGNVFEINAKGKIPCGTPVCAQALREVRDTVNISNATAGTYYLKFYNNSLLLKTDTVTVN
jgi:hypothetical protein